MKASDDGGPKLVIAKPSSKQKKSQTLESIYSSDLSGKHSFLLLNVNYNDWDNKALDLRSAPPRVMQGSSFRFNAVNNILLVSSQQPVSSPLCSHNLNHARQCLKHFQVLTKIASEHLLPICPCYQEVYTQGSVLTFQSCIVKNYAKKIALFSVTWRPTPFRIKEQKILKWCMLWIFEKYNFQCKLRW